VTVHARGYRPYVGTFTGAPGWWIVLQAGVRTTLSSKGTRRLGVMFMLWFVILAVVLYVQVGLAQGFGQRHAEGVDTAIFRAFSRKALIQTLATFYSGVTALVTLLAILTGAGLIADDLRARALTFYLVRPIRAVDYAIGKALVLPYVLLTRTAIPGVAFWLLAGSWQEPGESGVFWSENADVLVLVLRFLLVASTAYTGLILLLSASTPRRGVVASLAAAVLFGGLVLVGIGARMEGDVGALLRLASIPMDAIVPFTHATLEKASDWHRDRVVAHWPDPDGAVALGLVLFAVGFARVWTRARSVEVTE
jgi:hypothetical protein